MRFGRIFKAMTHTMADVVSAYLATKREVPDGFHLYPSDIADFYYSTGQTAEVALIEFGKFLSKNPELNFLGVVVEDGSYVFVGRWSSANYG